MSADEMFEKLGYKKRKEQQPKKDEIKEIIIYKNDKIYSEIEFWNDKTIIKVKGYDSVDYISIEELQAINKKVEELGWK